MWDISVRIPCIMREVSLEMGHHHHSWDILYVGTGVEKRGGRCDGGIRLSAHSEREGRGVPVGMTASV